MSPWYEDLFTGPWLDVHEQEFTEIESRVEAERAAALLGLEPGMAVLDVPCGVGRHAVPLAGAGIRVTGVDLSSELLERARARAAEAGVEVRWHRSDMRELRWAGAFDGALCMWGSFGYFDDRGNLDFLRAVARALRPGAGLLLDTHTYETLLSIYQPRGWHRAGSTAVLEERMLDVRRAVLHTTWRFVRDGREWERRSAIRLYTARELVELLEEAGFGRVDLLGGLSGALFTLRSRRMVVLARR